MKMMMRCVVAAAILVVIVGRATAAFQCSNAVAKVLPCEGFLVSGSKAPSAACCSAVQWLGKMAAASSEDRKAICKCFKGVGRSFPINLPKAQLIPQLCNVTVGAVALTPDIDCDRSLSIHLLLNYIFTTSYITHIFIYTSFC